MFNKRFLSTLLVLCFVLTSAGTSLARRSKYKRKNSNTIEENKNAEVMPATSLDELRAGLDEVLQGLSGFDGIEGVERDFVLGYAEFRREKWKDANRFFEKVQDDIPLIGDHVLYYRAVIANHLSRYDEAVSLLDTLSKKYPNSVWNREAVYVLAKSLVALGHNAAAQKKIRE